MHRYVPLVAVFDIDGEEDGGNDDATGRGCGKRRVDGEVYVGVLELLEGAVLGRSAAVLPADALPLGQVQLLRHAVELPDLDLLSVCRTTRHSAFGNFQNLRLRFMIDFIQNIIFDVGD